MIYIASTGNWKTGIIPFGNRMGIYYWGDDGIRRMSTTKMLNVYSIALNPYPSNSDVIRRHWEKFKAPDNLSWMNKSRYKWAIYWDIVNRIKGELPKHVLRELWRWPSAARLAVIFGYSYMKEWFDVALSESPMVAIFLAINDKLSPSQKRKLSKLSYIDIATEILASGGLGLDEELFNWTNSFVNEVEKRRRWDVMKNLVTFHLNKEDSLEAIRVIEFFRKKSNRSRNSVNNDIVNILSYYNTPIHTAFATRGIIMHGLNPSLSANIGRSIGRANMTAATEEEFERVREAITTNTVHPRPKQTGPIIIMHPKEGFHVTYWPCTYPIKITPLGRFSQIRYSEGAILDVIRGDSIIYISDGEKAIPDHLALSSEYYMYDIRDGTVGTKHGSVDVIHAIGEQVKERMGGVIIDAGLIGVAHKNNSAEITVEDADVLVDYSTIF